MYLARAEKMINLYICITHVSGRKAIKTNVLGTRVEVIFGIMYTDLPWCSIVSLHCCDNAAMERGFEFSIIYVQRIILITHE